MEDFELHLSTKVLFGKNKELEVSKLLKENNAKKVLLHYGGGSIKRSGLYDNIVNCLNSANIDFIGLGNVKPNPRINMVKEGIDLCKSENVDFILAVGGGSVIDSAKAIAMGVYYEGDVWEIFEKGFQISKALPIGTILTIPAAGSEMSMFTVITNDEDKERIRKFGYGSPVLKPVFSILNPELTFTLPKNQTAYGIADMYAHIIERYFSNTKSVDVTDKMCEGVMQSIINNAKTVIDDPKNYDARAEIMLAGCVAHNNILGIGREQDWASHAIEHELSAKYDIAHGEGLAIVIPAWMKYVSKKNPYKFVQYATEVFGINEDELSKDILIKKSIEATEKFFKTIGLPLRLSDIDLKPTKDEIEYMASNTRSHRGTLGSYVELERKDIEEILNNAL